MKNPKYYRDAMRLNMLAIAKPKNQTVSTVRCASVSERCYWGCNPPFFPAWSSQFSKVQGPQAPQGDTWQSIGQGTWQSWEVLGTGPWHRRFSTGRDAAEQDRSKVMCNKTPQKLKADLLSSYSGSINTTTEKFEGVTVVGWGSGRLICFYSSQSLSLETPEMRGSGGEWKKREKKRQQYQQSKAVKSTRYPLVWYIASPLACQNDELAMIISPHLTVPCQGREARWSSARSLLSPTGRRTMHLKVCSDSRQWQRLWGCFIFRR